MTTSNVLATQNVAYAFLDEHYPWLPKPAIVEWDNLGSPNPSEYYTGKDGATIAVPKYSDAWFDGDQVKTIHECGHVLFFYLASKGAPVVEDFLAAMGGEPTLIAHPLVNEILAEHFVRSYVSTYGGDRYPQLVGLVPFDAAKMRAYCESLRPPVSAPAEPTPLPPIVDIPPGIPVLGVDYMNRQSAVILECLAATGVKVVLRYYSPSAPKCLTAEEVADIFAAGLGIVPVWETTGGARPYYPWGNEYFTPQMGASDAVEAVNKAIAAGQPQGTVIFFAIDNPDVDTASTVEYWNSVYNVVHPAGYLVGMYGFEKHIRYARENGWAGIAAYWQTYGNDPGVDVIWQYMQQDRCGVNVDLNLVPENLVWKGEDMASEETIREWAKQEARAVLAQEYGPALEAELTQRFGQNSDNDIARAVAESVKAVGDKLLA